MMELGFIEGLFTGAITVTALVGVISMWWERGQKDNPYIWIRKDELDKLEPKNYSLWSR